MARGWKRERLGAIGFCDGPALRRTTLDTPVSPLVGLQAGGFSVLGRCLSTYLSTYPISPVNYHEPLAPNPSVVPSVI